MTLLLGFVALGLSFVLPGHYPPWSSFEQQAIAVLALFLIGVTVLDPRRERGISAPRLAWLAAAAAVIPLLQLGVGKIEFIADALMPSLYLVVLSCSICIGATLTRDRSAEFLDGLGYALIASGALSTCIAVLQWWGSDSSVFTAQAPVGGRALANLAQPNHLSTLVALSSIAVIRLFEKRRLPAVAAVALLALCGLGLVLTQSRTGWLLVSLFAVWHAGLRKRVQLRTRLRVVIGGAVLFFVAVAALPKITDLLFLSGPASTERLQAGSRWLHWQTLCDAISRAPWTGYGWSQVGLAQQAAALDHPASHEWLTNSHNLVLDLSIWNGIPIGLLLFGALMWWLFVQIRACRTPDQWALLAGVGVLLTHAMLEYPLDYTYFLIVLGLMMGAVDALNKQRPLARIPKAVFAVPFVLAAAMSAWVAVEYLEVQESVRAQRFLLERIGIDTVSSVPPPDVVLLDNLRERHRLATVAATTGMTAESLAAMQASVDRYPTPSSLLRYALAAGLNNRPEQATRYLALICKLHIDERCKEAIVAWGREQEQHPELRNIPAPTRDPVDVAADRMPVSR